MKTLHPLEQNHVFCEICGKKMERTTTYADKTYDRRTGIERPGAASHWWQCPNYVTDMRHDREVFG